MEDSATGERWRAGWAAATGLILITCYATVGAFQVLVWNPQAAVPGRTLGEIRTAMASANESLAVPLVLAWAVTGVLLAGLVLIAAQRSPGLWTSTVVRMDLLLLVLAAPSHWFASFPAGMGIADTFATTGGDHTPWGGLLYLVSAVAMIALVVVMFLGTRRPPSLSMAGP